MDEDLALKHSIQLEKIERKINILREVLEELITDIWISNLGETNTKLLLDKLSKLKTHE